MFLQLMFCFVGRFPRQKMYFAAKFGRVYLKNTKKLFIFVR